MEAERAHSHREIGNLTLTIKPDALQKIVEDGRLLEFATTLATEAAAQISAQVVDHVAQAALTKGSGPAGASFSYIFDGGDFGTVPPRPHWGVTDIGEVTRNALSRVVQPSAER